MVASILVPAGGMGEAVIAGPAASRYNADAAVAVGAAEDHA